MTEERSLSNQPKHSGDSQETYEEQLATIMAAERAKNIKWAVIGLLVVLTSVGLFVLFATYRTFFFRPKPDMIEVERVAFEKTNDPACRTMLTKVDELKDRWNDDRDALRPLIASKDLEAIADGRARLQAMIENYKFEQRRREIIITKEPRSQGELAQYFKHVLFYLQKMDTLLADAQTSLQRAPEAADSPKVDEGSKEKGNDEARDKAADPTAADEQDKAGGDAEAETPQKAYERAWRLVTEDHDKWRVYRQGPVPCGAREGEPPPVPEKMGQVVTPTPTPEKGQDDPKTRIKVTPEAPSGQGAGEPPSE